MSPPRRRRPETAAQLPLIPSPPPLSRTAWVGPFQPTLERRWLDALPRLAGADPLAAAWLLVPSRFLGLHLTRLAARHQGVVNLHVLTFTDLADRLAGAADARPRKRLPRVGDVLVLRQAIRDAVPDDGYFAAVRDARRFPAALAVTLAELRTAGVGAADLERAADAARGASARKLREVARIVERADAALAATGFHHPTEVLWAAAAHVAEGPGLRDPGALAIYGFTEWNAAERALIRALAARVPTACFVPAEPGPPFEALAELLAWLRAEGFGIEGAETPLRVGARALAARLFRELEPPATAPVGPGTAGLEIVAAPGEEREVREIARRLIAAAAEGMPFDAMGILVRRPDAYRNAIRDVFAAAGIPYTWGVAPRLSDTRAGRSLRLLFAARQERFARAAVLEFLATASLREGDAVEPAEWDRLSREARIVGGAGDWRRGLAWLAWRAGRATPGTPPDDEGHAPERRPASDAVNALGRVVGHLLASAGAILDQAPAATVARALGRAFLRLCRRDAESEQIAGLLGSLQDLAPLATPLSLDEFGELLDAALEVPTEPGPESRQDKVFVGELHQALGLPFRLVVIPGLVEQGFPAPPRSDPILLDAERELLHRQVEGGRPGLSLAAHRPAEDRLAFRLATAAAEERLVLTYPRVDPQSGRARVPSFFLLRVAEAATGLPYDFSRLEREFPPHVRVPLVPAPPSAIDAPVDRREWLLAQATRARAAGAAGHAACLALLPHATRGRAALTAREQSDHVSAWDGLLPDGLLGVLAAHHRPIDAPVAATPLQAYATCPFRYYLAHVLGIAKAVEPERIQTLAPADRGRLLHVVLADAYAAFRASGLLPLTPDRVPAARTLLDAALAHAEERFATGLVPFWRGERSRLFADLCAALDAEARATASGDAWVPIELEVGFGAGDAPSVPYPLPDGRVVRFVGRLDRLDLSPDGTRARVIDYKSGVSPSGTGVRLGAGTALQLPIYRLGAEALCRARGLSAEVEEAQYYYLTRRGRRRRLRFAAADWLARREDFDRVLAVVVDGIAAGRFFQNPSAETCRSCDYQAACGSERERIAWVARKLADPVREAYHGLQAIE